MICFIYFLIFYGSIRLDRRKHPGLLHVCVCFCVCVNVSYNRHLAVVVTIRADTEVHLVLEGVLVEGVVEACVFRV
jgi:hypothetical protein